MRPLRVAFFAAVLSGLLVGPAQAAFHLMQIEQVMGGVNGDPNVQAIQLRLRAAGQNFVQGTKLVVRDATGNNPVELIQFPTNVLNGAAGARVLVATSDLQLFTNPSIIPDFGFTQPIPATYLAAGTLTFEDSFGQVYWRLSWGGAGYSGPGTGVSTNDLDGQFNPPFPFPLPAAGHEALLFQGPANALSSDNANDYAITPAAAVFTNNANESGTITKPAGLVIDPGIDLFVTPAGASHQDFGPIPIPADFFGPGSDPFDGQVDLRGVPIDPSPTSPLGPTDTIVRRLDSMVLPGPGEGALVPIEIVALHLQSVAPITVTYNGGQNPQTWDIEVCLSSAVPQIQGTLAVSAGCDPGEGGLFQSLLPVQPLFVFTRVDAPAAPLVLDTGAFAVPPLQFAAQGWWAPFDPGFNIIQVGPGLQVDHDCNPATPLQGPLPGSSNFIMGIRAVRCDDPCVGPLHFIKRMTIEDALLAQHGVLPAQICLGDFDIDGICDDADNCLEGFNPGQADEDNDGVGDLCDNCALYNPCQEDLNGNGVGDLCDLVAVDDTPLGPNVLLGLPRPNPTTGVLSYSVTMPHQARVRAQIFDIQGALIHTLIDEVLGAGEHGFTWDAARESLRSGVYYMRLETGRLRQTRAFTFMR